MNDDQIKQVRQDAEAQGYYASEIDLIAKGAEFALTVPFMEWESIRDKVARAMHESDQAKYRPHAYTAWEDMPPSAAWSWRHAADTAMTAMGFQMEEIDE